MNTIVLQRDVAALGQLLRLSTGASATAGGTGDATTVTGLTIDRFANGSPMGVMDAGVAYEATLASGATLSIGSAVQDSADGTNWSDYQTAAAVVAATGPSAGGAVGGMFDLGSINLSSARRYVRVNIKPDLSATGTDTASFRSVGFGAGFDRLPN